MVGAVKANVEHTHLGVQFCNHENWRVNHHVFAVRAYSEAKSILQMQRRFWHGFDAQRHGRIPLCNATLKWVHDFNVRGSAVNKSVGPACSVLTSENSELVIAVVQQGPVCSAMRHSRRTDVKQVPLENSTLSLEEPYVQI
jgi:hypothetical protein